MCFRFNQASTLKYQFRRVADIVKLCIFAPLFM
jgi:hypothetical protein